MPTSDLIHSLPDAYNKGTNSNNYKLLALHGEAVDSFRQDIKNVMFSQDLQTATGYSLDLYGAEVEQSRGKANDALYRVLIQQKMARDRGIGTWDSVSSGIRNVLNCSDSDFCIHDSTINRKVVFRVVNSQVLEKSPLTEEQVKKVINQLLPATVKFVVVVPYPGSSTFEIHFVPVRLSIHSRMNIWMIDSVRLNGVKRLDGTWTLNQEVRNHFLLSLLRISSGERYNPTFVINVQYKSYGSVQVISIPNGVEIFSHQEVKKFSCPVRFTSRTGQPFKAVATEKALFLSHENWNKSSKTTPEIRTCTKTNLTMACKKFAAHSKQPVTIEEKTIKKTTNPVWTLNGAYLMNGTRRFNAGQVVEEVL